MGLVRPSRQFLNQLGLISVSGFLPVLPLLGATPVSALFARLCPLCPVISFALGTLPSRISMALYSSINGEREILVPLITE